MTDREKSGRRKGTRHAAVKTPSEIAAFVEAWNSIHSHEDMERLTGLGKETIRATLRRLRQAGYPLKALPRGRPVKPVEGLTERPTAIPEKSSGKLSPPEKVKAAVTPKAVVKAAAAKAPKLDGDACERDEKLRMAEALVSTNMNVLRACEATGTSTDIYYRWRRQDAAFQELLKQTCIIISDKAAAVAVELALGLHHTTEKPDSSMVKWVAEKFDPDRFGAVVKHHHGGVIGHAMLGDMTDEAKKAELNRLLRLRGIDVDDAEDGEIVDEDAN